MSNETAIRLRRNRTPNQFAGMMDGERSAVIEKLKSEFFERGGTITKVRTGVTGLKQKGQRVPAWRRIRF